MSLLLSPVPLLRTRPPPPARVWTALNGSVHVPQVDSSERLCAYVPQVYSSEQLCTSSESI
eukprot:1160978-Pelagomonas_calceolata.AAC.1